MRLFRLVRLCRALRIVRRIRPRDLLVHGFFSNMQAIRWATVLLGFMLLTWANVAVYVLHPLVLRIFGTDEYGSARGLRCNP